MIDIFQHPIALLGDSTISPIRDCSHKAEILRQLHPDQLRLVLENKWFKALIPKAYGGMGLTLPELVRLEEALSYADGSAGWVVTLCSGAGWFVGFVNPGTAAEFFTSDNVCIAGSGAVTGVAEQTEDGYIVNGIWRYASGILHATALTANCHVTRNGKPVFDSDGSQKVASFIFKREEVIVHDAWRAMGMIATGSHSFEVKNVQVDSDRCFHIDAANVNIDEPVYRYPFLQLAESTLAVNLSGMAIRFAELASSPARDGMVNEAIALLNESRKLFFEAVDTSWTSLTTESGILPELLSRVSEKSRALVKTCREAVNDLYPHCGLTAAITDNEINRVWRNFNTAGQHALFAVKEPARE